MHAQLVRERLHVDLCDSCQRIYAIKKQCILPVSCLSFQYSASSSFISLWLVFVCSAIYHEADQFPDPDIGL